jgi:hypothetical protein
MLFCLLNDPRFPCPRSHVLHVRKLAAGFVQRGYRFLELRNVNEIKNLCQEDIVYVSNHFSVDFFHKTISGSLRKSLTLSVRESPAKFIFWNFHTVSDWSQTKEMSSRIVHLSEDMYVNSIEKEPKLRAFREEFNTICLKYSSPFHPSFSPLINENRKFDFNFVGHGYQKKLTAYCRKKYNSFIRNTPPIVNEIIRLNSFAKSKVNLVFHASSNISKGIVVERFAEALSMGGLIFHDHPRISSEFPGHPSIFFVKSENEIDDAFNYVRSLSNEDIFRLRTASSETWRKSGLSYFDQAGKILKKFDIETLTGIDE